MEELIYTIDRDRSEQDELLVIKIQVAKRTNHVLSPLEEQPLLTLEKLNALTSARDASVIPFLIQEEGNFLKKNTGRPLDRKFTSLNLIHVSPKETQQALKLFAMSGKLYYHCKPLVIDLYSKTELYYSLSSDQKTSAHIRSGEQSFELSACDRVFKGPPKFIIKGVCLKILTTDISWNDLKNGFLGNFRPIHELIDESNEDPDAPRVVVNSPIPATVFPEPLPVLVLKDRYGSFADLLMDYGEPGMAHYNETLSMVRSKSINRLSEIEKAWEKDLLETDFIRKSVGESHYYCPLDKVAKSIAFLLEIGWQVRDWRNNRILLQTDLHLQTELNADEIIVKGKVLYGEFEADLKNIIGSFNRRERFAEIAPGHVALLPDSWDKCGIENLVEDGEIVSDGIQLKRNSIGSIASLFEAHPRMQVDPDMALLKERIQSFETIQTKKASSAFQGSLRSYQQEGLNWLCFLHDFGFHGILADDMGLGKTVQVIAFLSTIKMVKPVLVVVPTSLIFNWKKEMETFLPSMPVEIHHGPLRKKVLENDAKVIITTYQTVRLDFDLFTSLHYSCLFLDEAQAIKNASTQTAQVLSRLNADFRLSITGTPIENHLMELWSHFNFLMPDLFGNEKTFAAEVQAGMSDPRFYKRINRMIRPFILRRKKSEVAKDLPEKIEQVVYVEMGEKQRAVYESFLSGVKKGILTKVSVDGVTKHRMEVLEAIMRLRQICCHPLLVGSNENESSKLDALMEDLETAVREDKKVLVYSQFTSMLGLISNKVREQGWKFVYLDGSTQDREKVVNEFQENPAINLFLVSLKAGGIGLNLTAADYVFLYDPWWNNAVENQAIDRAHRIGRKDTVIAKRYIALESIEEKILKLKAAKSILADDILDDGALLNGISANDLLFLLT